MGVGEGRRKVGRAGGREEGEPGLVCKIKKDYLKINKKEKGGPLQ